MCLAYSPPCHPSLCLGRSQTKGHFQTPALLSGSGDISQDEKNGVV